MLQSTSVGSTQQPSFFGIIPLCLLAASPQASPEETWQEKQTIPAAVFTVRGLLTGPLTTAVGTREQATPGLHRMELSKEAHAASANWGASLHLDDALKRSTLGPRGPQAHSPAQALLACPCSHTLSTHLHLPFALPQHSLPASSSTLAQPH